MKHEKAVLTQREAEALKKFSVDPYCTTLEDKICRYLAENKTWIYDYRPLRDMGFEKFLQALIVGYEVEVEDTPHEKLRKEHKTASGWKNTERIAYRSGIRTALAILGEKVEGINT